MKSSLARNPPHFQVIYADPPWLFKSRGSRSGRQVPYPCLSTTEIASLPIAELCAPNCVLFLWAIYPMLPDAFSVIRAWGFSFRTVAFTWVKSAGTGHRFHFGMGYWTRANPEI